MIGFLSKNRYNFLVIRKKESHSMLKNIFVIPFFLAISIASWATGVQHTTVQQQLVMLEKNSGGRLGVFAWDTGNDKKIAYRANERFPFCSTFKVLAVAAILKQSMQEPTLLQKRIFYTPQDLQTFSYTPISQGHVTDGMTVKEICAATMMYSDNAVNLLMQELGGPQAVTTFARSIGDKQFQLDRWEPELNASIPGDTRDTTTPIAMGNDLNVLVLGHVLGLPQRHQLQYWLKHNTTGNARIRAGVPKDWIVGDKTGTSNEYGTTNDVAVIWFAHGSPIVMVIYFTQDKKDSKPNDALIASVAKVVINALKNEP
jgi:beta-lactamase class A